MSQSTLEEREKLKRSARAAQLKSLFEADLRELEKLIAATPTSEERNRYCDAQIHVRAAMEKLA